MALSSKLYGITSLRPPGNNAKEFAEGLDSNRLSSTRNCDLSFCDQFFAACGSFIFSVVQGTVAGMFFKLPV